MSFQKITESESLYHNLEQKTVAQILADINQEDQKVALVVQSCLAEIEALAEAVAEKMLEGGRLFYMGAGTSGRLGILDASECPPTFGVAKDLVIGLIAGGATAITTAVEKAEDDLEQGWQDLLAYDINTKDVVVGLAASGTTPYVIGALNKCRRNGILTGSISCNPNSPMSACADFPIEAVVGPEYVTGSTRMKSGTAQKLVLNMISTTVMIQLGRVEGNRMVNMQLSNEKLVDRGIKMLMLKANMSDYEAAKKLLLESGSVKNAMETLTK